MLGDTSPWACNTSKCLGIPGMQGPNCSILGQFLQVVYSKVTLSNEVLPIFFLDQEQICLLLTIKAADSLSSQFLSCDTNPRCMQYLSGTFASLLWDKVSKESQYKHDVHTAGCSIIVFCL